MSATTKPERSISYIDARSICIGMSSSGSPEIVELTPSPADLEVLRTMYPLYRAIFPSDEEAETLENLERYLTLKAGDYYGDNSYHVLVMKVDGRVVGFAIGDYYADPSVGVIEFLGVEDGHRGRGLGSALEEEFVRRASADAAALGKELRGIFIEVEDPEVVGKWGSVGFWYRRGYMFVPVRYVQPPLSRGKRRAKDLRLMFRPIPQSTIMDGDLLLAFLRSYFHYAMSIEDPTSTEEYRLVARRAGGRAFTLEDPGSSLIRSLSLRIFFTVDLLSSGRPEPEVGDAILASLRRQGGRIPYASYGGGEKEESSGGSDGDGLPAEILLRRERDHVNLRRSYLRHTRIVRFGPLDSFDVYVVRGDGRRIRLGSASIYGSYRSLGTFVVEVVIRGEGAFLISTMVRAESIGNLRVRALSGTRSSHEGLSRHVRRTMKGLLGDVVRRPGSIRWIHSYPLLIVESIEGNPTPNEIYGLVNADGSYRWVSASEISRAFCGRPSSSTCDRGEWIADLSVVDGIMAMYEPRSALVLGRSPGAFMDAFEEIYGVPLHSLPAGASRDALAGVEAEYSSEVEMLREQFSVLWSLHDLLSSWDIRGSTEEEYRALTELEVRLHRRMAELHALDVGFYESLREVLRSAQRRMGIEELRSTVEDLASELRREIDVRYQLSENRRLLHVQFLLTVLAIFQAALGGITIAISLGYSPVYTAAAAAVLGAASILVAHRIMFWRRRR
jgi:GNAT superfamily N-acetyltransferase